MIMLMTITFTFEAMAKQYQHQQNTNNDMSPEGYGNKLLETPNAVSGGNEMNELTKS